MTEQKQLLWNQYAALREEITKADEHNFQLLGVLIAAVAAMLNIGFAQNDTMVKFLILLSVYLVTIPGYLLMYANRRRIWRTATYLRVFLEPDLEPVRWEERLAHLYLDTKRPQRQPFTLSTRYIVMMLNLFAGFSIVGVVVLQLGWHPAMQVLSICALFLWNVYLFLILRTREQELQRGGSLETGYYKGWLEVKALEEKNVP